MVTFVRSIDSKKAIYVCTCGAEFTAFKSNISSGHTRSCGCLRRQVTRDRSLSHGGRVGMAKTKAYVAWTNMRARCENAARPDFMNYGGRGINVCDRWMKFENFLADMGEPLANTSLDRIDNARGYSPDNCRWASRRQQARNKRTTVMHEYAGRSMCLTDWSDELGIGRVTLLKRLQRGVPLNVALSTKGFLKWKK